MKRAVVGLATALMACLAALAWQQRAPSGAAPAASTASSGVTLTEPIALAGLGRERRLRIYLPPSYGHSARRYPVLYMHDGQNLFDAATSFAGEWGVDEALDTLAHTHGVELIVVGIDNGGDTRITELNPWDHETYGKGEGQAYLEALIDTVKPYVDAHYRTRTDARNTLVAGSSLGGLMSHYAALTRPDIFGSAAIFSPSYWIAEAVYERTRAQGFQPGQRLFFLMGGAEGGSMLADFERMQALLHTTPAQYLFIHVAHAEHREIFWRSQFIPAILWLLQA